MPLVELGKTLTALRKAKKLVQADVIQMMAARGLPVAAGTFSRWERDKAVPPADQFLGLCQIYGVRDILGTFKLSAPVYVDPLSKEGRRKVDEFEQILIASNMFSAMGKVLPFQRRQRRVYDENPVSAGTGQLLESPTYTMVDIDDDVPDCVDFGVRVSGDSMEPTFVDGQIVWIQKRDVLEDGEIGIFYLNGQSFIKKFKTASDGIKLVSLNAEKYAPIAVTENDEFRTFGKVIY
jgi:repressor LexA